MRMNRAYVKRLENLIIRLDCTLSDLDAERATGNLERDMPAAPQAGRRDTRQQEGARTRRSKQKSESNNCRG